MSYRTVSLLVPCFNERATLEALLRRVLAAPLDLERELIVVDDGSTDGSRELLERLERDSTLRGQIKALFHPRNRGKGAAIRTALAAATGDLVVIQDADLEYEPAELGAVLAPIREGRTRVCYGSRRAGRPFEIEPGRFWFTMGNQALTSLANVLYGAELTDGATGYKAFDAALLRSLPLCSEGFEFCAEVTALVRRLGEPILEVPISYAPRSVAEGKKLRYAHGLGLLWTLLKHRVRP